LAAGSRTGRTGARDLSYEPRVLELIDLKPALAGPPPTPREQAKAFVQEAWRAHAPLIVLFVVPVLVSVIYLFAFSADRYHSEARFVVRSPASPSMGSVEAILSSGGAFRATDDAYAINAYLDSHDALQSLLRTVDVRAAFSRAGHDPLWRFPPWLRSDTREALFDQYRRLVTIRYDKTSGISSLKVQAFTAQDAQAIARALLANAEVLANRLSARARQDAVREAELEVEKARQRTFEALDRITEYRNRERVVDPTLLSNSVIQTIARLSVEIAQTNATLSEVGQSAGQSPQLQPLRVRIQALEQQVVAERQRLAGADTALATKIAEFEILKLEKDFKEKLLASSINLAESARMDMGRQQLYIERVVDPPLPESAEAPRRWLLLGVVAFLCFLVLSAYNRLRQARSEKRRSG
jgi:capsular polysaccharide transport system permease protein